MQEYKIKISGEDEGRRLDIFLAAFAKENKLGLSRAGIQKLISKNCINLKNSPTSPKAHYKLKSGDQVTLFLEDTKEASLGPENIPLDIIYEDDYIAVINKPTGLVVHPAPGNFTHTLVNALLFQVKNLSDINPQRPGIVHRLDKDTSGLLVVAKNNDVHLKLAKQFSEHTIKRKYIALVNGVMEFDENVIELPIGRHPVKRKNMAVGFTENTKYAKTYYRTLKRLKSASYLELEPFTGRTHQLRVHLAHIGHYILGDTKYGKNNIFKRLFLHAKSIGFIHPHSEKFVEFNSEVPEEFKVFINKNT